MEDPKQSKADLIPADDYGGFEEFDSIEDEHPPEDAKKKVSPPPKKDLLSAMKEDIGQKKDEAQAAQTTVVKKNKSIKKMKEELGPLTEDLKDDMVDALNELKAIVRIKRRLIYDMFLLKNKEELREINERINANRIYIDGDPDPATGEENVMRRMPALEGRFLVTFRGFVDVLSSFQLSAKEKVLKLVLDKLGLYNWRIDTVDYPNFFSQLLRFKGEFNSLLMKFNPQRPLKLSDNKSEMAALIQKRVREVLKKIRANPDLKKESKGRERNKEIDLNVYTPKLIIERLQEECLQSNVNPKKQLEKYTLQNKDVYSVTYDKLKDFMFNDLKFVGLSTVFVDQLFRMLDWKATERVSLNDVVSLIYGESKEHLLTIPRTPEELLVVVSDAARFHYDLGSRFMKFCKHADPANIKLSEFVTFVTSFTRLKEEHCKILFQHLEQGGKGVIFESNILNIYEYTLKKDKADPRKKEGKKEPTLKELKSHDNSELDERFKSFNNMDLSGIGGLGGFGGDGPQIGWGGTSGGIRHGTMENLEDQGEEAVQEFSVAANNQVRLLKDEIEEQVMRISVMTLEMIKYHGKNIKDLFQMFADKLTRLMNLDEFYEAVKFITKDEEADEAVLKNLYFLLSHPMSKKVSFSKFLALIEMGKKMNSIYIKLKKRFGEGFMDYRALFLEELQRMNIKKADGYVPFIDVRKLFAINKIEINEIDCEMLKDDGIMLQRDRQNVINIFPFIEKVFPHSPEFSNFIHKKNAKKILKRFRMYKLWKVKRVKEDEFLNKIFGDDSGMGPRKSKVNTVSKGKGLSRIKNKEESKDVKIKTAKEMWEIQDPKKPEEVSPVTGKEKGKKGKKQFVIKSTEEKMSLLLPKKETVVQNTVHRQAIEEAILKILLEIVDNATSCGESLLLTKNVQRRFANRAVVKDNIVVVQEEGFGVSDIIPRSISSIPSIGRILYLSNEGSLNQFDLINSHQLANINLSSKVPMKKDEILDYLMDSESGLLYILKMSWILEMWNIFQKARTPAAKVRLALTNDSASLLTQSYKNRYLGTFPTFLSLSQNNRQILTVNCTMINGSIFFLDPISLSIVSQAKIRRDELHISDRLNKIFFLLKPFFAGLAKQGLTFEKIFANDFKSDAKTISTGRFEKYVMEELAPKVLSPDEIKDLIMFIDQSEDNELNETEWNFMQDNMRLAYRVNEVHAGYEIPDELKNMNLNVAKIFYDIYEYMQKQGVSLTETFKIFDSDNSGSVSEIEFLELMEEISKESTLEQRRQFFKFIDKDGSRSINIAEFNNLFKMFGKFSLQELLPSENPRLDLFSIIEKAFDCGIDLEAEFLKHDMYKDGGVEPHRFKLIILNLPFGLTEEDVDYYIEKAVSFTMEGNINYLELCSNPKFKRIQYIFKIKQGLKQEVDFNKESESPDKFQGSQKIVIESIIHISSEDVFVFTTVSPKTSMIFIAKMKNTSVVTSGLADKFEAQIVAKLEGHSSNEPPSLLYVNESGCLISGEKLPVVKEGLTSAAFEGKNNDTFSRFYSNVTNNKARSANILIWNLSKDLFEETRVNPPWKLKPSRIIEGAHFDSIISLAYMPLGQLVASASTDGCIKMWDPVARAHSLTHKDSRVAVKPGHYTKNNEEGTITNESFSEVRRIYTGELTCYSLIAISHRIPLLDANDAIPKFQNIEFLASLELGKAQKSAGRLRTEGQIKVYGVERIGIEIPVSRFEEPIPKQLWAELNDLAIQTRQSSKLLFKRTLSTSLDKLMSKLVIQKAEISKISGLLKSVTLQRYTNKDDERYSSRLFELLINLPIRNNTENERVLTIDELHMHLKRNNYLYPSSIGKDAFVTLVRDLIHKNKRYLVDHRTKNQNKVLNAISQKIISNDLDIDLFFSKEVYSWNEMKKVLEPIAADDDQMEEFLTNLDPFYSNSIKLDAIKNFFSTEIIEAKIKDFARPSLIISQINAKLNKANKVELLRNLFMADSQGIGRINIVSFLSAFSSLSRQIDENLLKELYQLLAEKHENELLLDLSYFCKKLLSHTEQFELARVYNALSKIKNSLRFRLMTLEDIFIDGETEFKGRSVQNLVITVSQFKAKIKELDITGLTEKDMSLIGNFLCTLDNEGVSSISYLNLNSYFKKIDLKYQFINLADYKQLVKEIKKIIQNKDEFLRKWKAVCNRELVGYAEIRILLNYFAINEDTIDMILLKFVDTETSSVLFFNKISSFLEMNAFLDDTKNLKEENAKSLAPKLLASQKDQGKEQEIETLPENNEKPRDSFDDLVDVIFKYDNRKSCSSALNVCKKFDKENTGRVNIADFINILLYNMEFGKHPETETVLFKFQNEMGMQNQMKTIEYTELFDRVETKRGTSMQKAQSMIMDKLSGEEETNLTLVIGKISDAIRGSNFNLEKALAFFDRDNMGLVMPNNFRKILHWSKVNLNELESAILEENLLLDNAINYKKFLDLLEINDKHINVQFNSDFWFAASKMVPFGLFGKLNQNLEFLRYTLSIYKKKERSNNPLITASILETILHDVKEFSNEEIQAILKYGVVGSINKIQQSIHKMESNELNWSFEYIHILHFLASIPVVFSRKKDLPENKDLGRKINEQDKEETERNHIVAKVKSMLHERGVTMWESLLSCSISVIEGSKIIKSDFLRMLRIMDLDLTMKEKVLILKSLDPRETGKIDLNNLLKTFESSDLGNMKTVQQSLLLEKMIYTLYYGGYSLGRAFDFIDEEKTGQISQKEFRHGIAKLSVNFSLFEINKIMEILGLVDPFTRITKSEFKKILKKLSKKYGIDPMQNFSISLLAKIKSIITTKNKNMLENFIEEDLHKSGYADLEMMKKALQKFGLNNIEMHEINTLVKMFKTDVNVNPADEELSEPEVEENKTLSLDLSAPQAKKEEEKEEEKLNINNPNFRIDYKEFVARIYEEVENNARLMIQGAFQVIRKVYNMTRIREFTIFEVFVYFDVNNLNMVSNMELRVGLQNLEIRLEKFEMTALWNVLEKNKDNKVTYTSFFNAFLNAGCIDVIQFDDKILKMLKKFNFLLSKHGNMDELFRKFDLQQVGYVCLAEFKTASEKMRLEFNGDELETMFKAFCTPEMLNPKLKKKKDGEDSDRGQQSHRSFNFKNFVTVMSFFRNRTNGLKLLHRLDVQVRDKGITYKKMFEDYLQGPGGKKKGTRNNTSRGDTKDVQSLTMADIKAMLQTLKFNFTLDEVNQICDTFETETISPKVMISIIENAVHKIENEANDRKNLYSKFVKEIDEAVQSRNTNVQKVFFEFDGRKDGTLKLGEFGDMISFLQIRANKTEVKSIFEEIDFDKNGHITMKEFQSFFDQTTFRDQNQELKDVQAKPTANHLLLDPVLKKLQECALKKQTSLERVIQGQQSDLNQIISLKLFEKALLKMDCVLKREELKLVVESASKDQSCSWGDLIDWGIKNNVDSRTKEKIYAQFPPSVQVLLSKLMHIYKKVNISVDTGYKYFLKDNNEITLRQDFLTLVQGFQIPTNEEELIALYNFFDERNYGEISKVTFVEKCEIAKDFYKWSENNQESSEKKGTTTITLRQHVMTILERLYLHFNEKNFNKKQIFAVFDKYGNGMIKREDFVKIIENLQVAIQMDHLDSVLNFLDSNQSGEISIAVLMKKMEEAVPDHARESLKYSQAQSIVSGIVSKLKVHLSSFLGEFLDLEKKIQNTDILSRTKTGVAIYDFYKLLSSFGVRLQEDEKLIMNSAFKNNKQVDYFITESLYLSMEKVSSELGAYSQVDGENLELWESNILRKVADHLRSMNLTLEKAFSSIQTNNLGFIKIPQFKQLIVSLQIDLTQKDIDLLVSRLVSNNNPNVISFEEFKQKFWACFFEGRSQINPLNIENRSRQIAAMFLHKIKYETRMPLSFAWDMLDRRRFGYALIDDLKEFLLEIKMPITKEDLGFLFTLIDKSADSQIDQFEFAEFWNLNLPADFEIRKTKLKKIESDVLGQIAKKMNNSERDIYSLFSAKDQKNSGFLDERQFSSLLLELNLIIDDSTVREIMRIVNGNNPERVSFTQLETALIRNGMKIREKADEVVVEFKSRLQVEFLDSLSTTANKLKIKINALVKEFDQDYDGLLTSNEFYNLLRTLVRPFKMDEVQKLAHMFGSPTSPNSIMIDKIIQAHSKHEKMHEAILDNLCDGDTFKAVLQVFDPTLLLFKRWGKLKQAKLRYEQYLQQNRDKLRGLNLLAVQYKLKELNEKIRILHKNIELLLASLKNKAVEVIKDEASVRWIDPVLCSLNMNKKEAQNIILKQDSVQLNQLASSQQFNLRSETQKSPNRFVQVFQGQLVQEQVPVEISLYPSESLKRISKDGKFFEDHLLYTTKLQTFLNQQHPDLFCRIHAIYSRKIGIDPKDRDLYVFYEVLGPDWVNFKDYISSTGGLVKIPFLVTSNSLFHVIKYWFQKILAIVDVVNQNSASCYIISPDNFYVNHKTLELRMKSLSGACQIHFDGTLSNISDLNLVLPTPTHVPEAQLQSFNVSEQFISNPYLAPEIFYTEVTDRTPFADSWSLGAILYFLIFGEDPKAIFSEFKEKDATSMKEPSDFVYYNLFDDRLVNEILQHDFGLKVDPTDNLIERSIRLKSFEGVFSRVNKEFNPQMLQSNSLNTQYSLGNFLDMLVLLMSWKPHRRPTARALLFSPLMKTDKYEEMQMRQFSSLSFFYRSPSKCVRNDVLLPLRAMCLTAIKKPKKAVLLTEDIMKVIDRIYAFTGSTESHVFANVNEEFSKSKQGPAELSSWHLLDSITQKMRTGEQKRLKAPNCCLIKFVFEHFILDILLFLVLRHHGAVNEALGAEELPAQKLEDHYYKPVKGFAAIMKRIVCDLQSYESASAPFVGSVIDLIVKFTVSEEFVLASDIIDDLEEEANLLIQTNTIDEYFQLQTSKTSILRNGRFFSTPKDEIDLLDRAWTESLSKKPYCFWSNNWSFYQCTLSTSLMKEAFGEAGLGSSNHPVLMDYNRFVQGLMKKPKFEAENTMNYINNLLKGAIVKTVDYFSEILILGSNMITLEDPNSGTTSLKVVINYVATILKSKNVDKVRAVLDSRIVLKCINFLQSENAQLKESILELIFEATKSFTRDHLYLYEQYDVNSKFDSIMDTKPRTADEVQKNFGLVSHLALTNEDKMNKSNYINCVRNYFDLNAKISEKYIRQISMAVAVPSFFVCLTTIIKTNTDLLRSKTFALDIIYNLTNAPFNVVRNFSHSSIDTLNTLAKIFVIKRSGKKNKVNEYLLPYSLKIFKNLVLDGRREILKMLENAVGLRTLLRDQQLVIPKRQTLATLAGKIDEVDVYYKNHFKDMMLEANQIMINRYTGLGASRVKAYHLTHFEELLRDCCVKIVCWLEFESNKTSEYSVSMLQDIIYRFIENIKYYFETFMEHYQTNETITACMLCISNFIETVCNQGFEYMVFDTVDTTRGLSNTEWVMLQVYSIYNFHQILGLEEKPEEGEKLLEHKINQIADLEERGRELSKFISNSACLTKYTTCRIAQAAHSFLRVLMLLLERDDPEYTALLEASHFVHFYSSLIQKQHALLQMFIRTKTESIHVIGRYVEESNLRIRIFEGILKLSSPAMKQELLESQTIHRITSSLLMSNTELDVSFYRSSYKFLVFRNFMPFRAEALSLISLVFWNKEANLAIYTELVNEIIKSNSLRLELEHLKQNKNRLLKVSALSFFSRLIKSGDKHISFLLREQYVYEALQKEFELDRELVLLFKDTHKLVNEFDSMF